METSVIGKPEVGNASSFWLYSIDCSIFSTGLASGEFNFLFCFTGLLGLRMGMCAVCLCQATHPFHCRGHCWLVTGRHASQRQHQLGSAWMGRKGKNLVSSRGPSLSFRLAMAVFLFSTVFTIFLAAIRLCHVAVGSCIAPEVSEHLSHSSIRSGCWLCSPDIQYFN